APEPTGNDAAHACPAGVLAICPAPQRRRLCEPGTDLSGSNEEPPSALEIRDRSIRCRTRIEKFFSREWGETDCFNKLILLLSKDAEKIHHLTIEIVIGFDCGWWPIQEDGGRAAKWLTIVVARWQQRQDPVEMTVLSTIP